MGNFDTTWKSATAALLADGPVQPGFHYYWFLIDGVPASDPSSGSFGWAKESSGLDVPDPALGSAKPQRRPHGDVQHHFGNRFKSPEPCRCVLTSHSLATLPHTVLYLQHCGFGAKRWNGGWTARARANFILSRLIAEATPMIIVMENGYATRAGTAPGPAQRGNEAFAHVVTQDDPRNDRARPTRSHSAHSRPLHGRRPGPHRPRQPRRASLHRKLQWWLPQLRPKDLLQRSLSDPAVINKQLNLLWFGCGPAMALPQRQNASSRTTHRRGRSSVPSWSKALGSAAAEVGANTSTPLPPAFPQIAAPRRRRNVEHPRQARRNPSHRIKLDIMLTKMPYSPCVVLSLRTLIRGTPLPPLLRRPAKPFTRPLSHPANQLFPPATPTRRSTAAAVGVRSMAAIAASSPVTPRKASYCKWCSRQATSGRLYHDAKIAAI